MINTCRICFLKEHIFHFAALWTFRAGFILWRTRTFVLFPIPMFQKIFNLVEKVFLCVFCRSSVLAEKSSKALFSFHNFRFSFLYCTLPVFKVVEDGV